jgi:hypothetical protein
MSVELQCLYIYWTFEAVGSTYYCHNQNVLNIISSESAVITGAKGSLDGNKSNDDVHGFYAQNKTIDIFPRGLEKIFKNLKAIRISRGQMQEIHQSDLKPFPQLEHISLDYNNIQILNRELFNFNHNLKCISFEYNKISQIHQQVFDHLTKLSYLYLNNNECIDKTIKDNSAGVKELIKEIKFQCPSPLTLKETAKEIYSMKKDLSTCQNNYFVLSPKMLKLQTTSSEISQKINNLESDMKVCKAASARMLTLDKIISEIEDSINNKITSDIKQTKDLVTISNSNNDKKIQDSFNSCNLKVESANEKITKLNNYLKLSNYKFNKLEKSLNVTTKNLENLKSEMFDAFQKILEKLDENSEKFERNAEEKINLMSSTLQSAQSKAYKSFNDKIINIEAGLSTLQSELRDSGKIVQESCDTDPESEENLTN